ncbi:hypothetical protein NIES2119_09950 [[Phormidium ambiguum] IAM M-71]|uniref:Uncharacterized protein n=1 Tax=[Phormidium ambiguum] IAM M-71 TaxID=454136 RepID=A0A1U7IMA1_9CYAN|nr:hypothetical protein [Phormidium ambiguum]OKH38350.1 hypothetical protein NIES2119_09950 [Phormidium ambiguum IAM M-71]
MKLLLATKPVIEIPVNAPAKVESINHVPLLEISAAFLSIGLAIAALIRAGTAKQVVLREAETELIKNLRHEIEEKDEEVETLKRKIYRLENRLRIADIELSGPINPPVGVYNGAFPQSNSGNY